MQIRGKPIFVVSINYHCSAQKDIWFHSANLCGITKAGNLKEVLGQYQFQKRIPGEKTQDRCARSFNSIFIRQKIQQPGHGGRLCGIHVLLTAIQVVNSIKPENTSYSKNQLETITIQGDELIKANGVLWYLAHVCQAG